MTIAATINSFNTRLTKLFEHITLTVNKAIQITHFPSKSSAIIRSSKYIINSGRRQRSRV